jgi:hypothetical protein
MSSTPVTTSHYNVEFPVRRRTISYYAKCSMLDRLRRNLKKGVSPVTILTCCGRADSRHDTARLRRVGDTPVMNSLYPIHPFPCQDLTYVIHGLSNLLECLQGIELCNWCGSTAVAQFAQSHSHRRCFAFPASLCPHSRSGWDEGSRGSYLYWLADTFVERRL